MRGECGETLPTSKAGLNTEMVFNRYATGEPQKSSSDYSNNHNTMSLCILKDPWLGDNICCCLVDQESRENVP